MSSHFTERSLPQIHDDAVASQIGTLEVRLPGESPRALPLASVAYRASVCEGIADVTLTQVFENPYAEHLEAVYTFPLSGGSAVRAFSLEVAGRVIRGIVKERAEAREEYRRAIEAGKRAAMLEQERDNVFTVQVGNLPPGERATVTISYAERLERFDDGRAELRLPLVVAPRYTPGAPLDRPNAGDGVEDDTDVVPDASRVTPPRLAGGSTAGPSVAIEVSLLGTGGSFDDLACSQHATAISFDGGGLTVRLAKTTERADRDFVLRWRGASDRVRPSLVVYRHPERGLFGMLTVTAPPAADRRPAPRDVVFLLDRSGSMNGVKMQSAARACSILLESLGSADRYAIAAFDTTVEWMGGTARFVTADEAGIESGTRFLRSVDARGGTEIGPALDHVFTALDRRTGGRERTPIVVVLTDGEVTNEAQVTRLVAQRIGDGRLFAVGIDTAVNDAMLKRLAAAGRGTALLVAPGDELERALATIAREIGTPEVVDLAIDDLDAGLDGKQAPERFADLFSGRAATVFLQMQSFGAVRVRGRRSSGGSFEEEVRAVEADSPAIALLWARARIADLEDQYRAAASSRDAIKQEIVDVSLAHQIVTRFTAYLAVDDAEVVNPNGSTRHVVQPVETPAEWQEVDQLAYNLQPMPASPVMMAAPSAAPLPFQAPTAGATFASGGSGRADEQQRSRLQDSVARDEGPLASLKRQVKSVFGGKDRAKAEKADRVTTSRLVQALEALARLLHSAVDEARLGRTVDVDGVERARVDALDLARAEAQSPLTSRIVGFLEGEAVEMVTALRTGGTTPASDAHWLAMLQDFETSLLPEIRRAFGGQASTGSFWE